MTAIELGKRAVKAIDIYGGDTVGEAAKIFINILEGKGTWAQNAVVLANAAMALECTRQYANYDDCYQLAVESLESGRALDALKKLCS
jgi:anthranilate phosphoribosyltransferase